MKNKNVKEWKANAKNIVSIPKRKQRNSSILRKVNEDFDQKNYGEYIYCGWTHIGTTIELLSNEKCTEYLVFLLDGIWWYRAEDALNVALDANVGCLAGCLADTFVAHSQFNELSSFLFLNFQNHPPQSTNSIWWAKRVEAGAIHDTKTIPPWFNLAREYKLKNC